MEPAVPSDFDLAPLTPRELHLWFKGGEPLADRVEEVLAYAARRRSGIDVAIAEGLHLLTQGERLPRLGFHLDDYGREVLDLGESATVKLARLGAKLRDRPLLAEAMRSGRVRLRAAQTVLSVAKGESERSWVDRAATLTVRELQKLVREAGEDPQEDDEDWLLLRTQLPEADRAVLDRALDLAGRELPPGSSRTQRLEALAQEFLGEWAVDDGDDDARPLGPVFRPLGERRDRGAPDEADLELRTLLPRIPHLPAPDVAFDPSMSAKDVDARLRTLAKLRASVDDVVGWCAHAIRKSGIFKPLGFKRFRAYVEQRLELPARAVEEREKLEEKLWLSPALREARRQRVSYERLRLLSRLKEDEIRSWIPRAKALTVVELKRRVEGEKERQMRAARKLVLPVPRRIAALVAAALDLVRSVVGHVVAPAKALAVLAEHFVETWQGLLKRRRTVSQKVRERDGGRCLVPGCSHPGEHAHHVEFRSQGGGDELENQAAECAFHHLGCIHAGHLVVTGRAPDALEWFLADGTPFTGTGGLPEPDLA